MVGLDIERRSVADVLAHDRSRLRKRQNIVSQTLDNEETLYYANLTLGTPAQNLRLHIDTGSSDLWVNTASSSFCQEASGFCQGGTYDSSSSSTYQVVNNDFNISYVDGSGATGVYAADTLTFGGQTLTDFQFGIGQTSSSQQGVLGIGYQINEVQVNRAGGPAYPNLPVALLNAGLINSNAYSLWLNDLDASTGTILFGGVNTAKYQGDLATIPILREYGDYYELTIALTGLSAGGTNYDDSSSLPAPALLDSGSTLAYLPNDLAEDIYNQVNAVYDSSAGVAYVPCSITGTGSIDFTFSGQTISVPYDELLLSAGTDQSGRPLTFRNGEEACLFGIAPAQGSTPVLGDTFLRSAYVVYDLENNEISLAQTVFNSTANDVREIGTGTGAVPGATAVASPVTTVAAGTGAARLGGGTTGTPTAIGGDPSSTANAAPALNKGSSSLGLAFAVLGAVMAL